MNYTETNKEAWEEVFNKHQENWKNNPIENMLENDFAFLNHDLTTELKDINLKDKDVAQFCCNNGRELLSIVKSGARSGTGFDFSENFIKEASRITELKNISCKFICTNIMDIGNKYQDKFDLVFCSIGTFCWFENLSDFFKKVYLVLKPNGTILISESHPILNIFGMEGEKNYDAKNPEKIINSYFKNDPWIDTDGIDYFSKKKYKSKVITSFSHTFSDIINSMITNNISIKKVLEYSYGLDDLFVSLDKGKIPLSMIIKGEKI